MIETILSIISHWVISFIEFSGYTGVFLLMLLESANIPVPSEIIMPFSGFLASSGTFSFWLLSFIGALGNLVGSLLSYFLASWIIKHKDKKIIKIFISDTLLSKSEEWFKKYGGVAVFFSRVMPVIRTFISLPAGLGKMNLAKFSIYTFVGSFIWSVFLTYFGWILGENWHDISPYMRIFEYIIVAGIIILFALWMYLHFYKRKSKKVGNE